MTKWKGEKNGFLIVEKDFLPFCRTKESIYKAEKIGRKFRGRFNGWSEIIKSRFCQIMRASRSKGWKKKNVLARICAVPVDTLYHTWYGTLL